MASRFTGIDILPNRIDVVQIRRASKGVMVEKAFSVPAGESGPDFSALGETLRIEGLNLRASAAVGLPDDSVLHRRLNTRLPTIEQFRKVIRSELEEELPWPYDEIAADIAGLWKRETGWDVLAVSARSSMIDDTAGALDQAGIKCTVANCAAAGIQAVIDAQMSEMPDSNYAWLHADTDRTLLGIVEDGQLAIVRNLAYSVDLASPDAAVALGREIDVAWRGVFNTEMPRPLKLVVSAPEPVAAALAEASSYATLKLDPAAGAESGNARPEMSPVAYGLALLAMNNGRGSANLLAARFSGDNERQRYKRQASVAIVLLVALAGLFLADIHVKYTRLAAQNQSLDAAIRELFVQTLPDERNIVDEKQQMAHRLELLRAEHAKLAPLFGRKHHPVTLLNDIIAALPPGQEVRMGDLSIGEQTIRLSGLADSFSIIEQFQNRLSEVPRFEAVEWVESDGRSGAIRFTIRITIAGAGAERAN